MPTATSRQRLRELLADLRRLAAGASAGAGRQLAHDCLMVLGVEALAVVREAFLAKARGGTDAAGLAWEPLSPRTVAYGRRHPGKSSRHLRPTLSAAQDARWRRLYAGVRAARIRAGDDPATAGRIAAGHAWNVLKAAGAQTVLQRYGGRKVEINRDTGRLLASLSPGAAGNALEVAGPTTVAVGSNVEYARHVHARRPLWPEARMWPGEWLERLATVLARALAAYVRREVR